MCNLPSSDPDWVNHEVNIQKSPAIGMTAISMNGSAFAQSEQFSPNNGLCAVGHTCTCTNGVFHDLTTGFSIMGQVDWGIFSACSLLVAL